MNPVVAQQISLANALVAPKDQVNIGKCNMRIDPTKTQKESTYQVVLDTLALSPYYNAFLITVDIPELYMQQFWFTISKIKDTSSYQIKLDKKKCRIGVDVFCEVLQIFILDFLNKSLLNHLLMKKLSYSSKKLDTKEIWNLLLSWLLITCTNHREPLRPSSIDVFLGKP
ncbi:hypothetical protein Tco_1480853 [Tanacetum coccineum]